MYRVCVFIGVILAIDCSSFVIAVPLCEAVSADGQCQAILTVSPDRPYLADTVTLTLDIACPDEVSVEFPPFGERIGELDIVDIKTMDRQLVLTAIPRCAGQTPIWAITIQCGEQRIDLPTVALDIAAAIDTENASLDTIGLSAESIPPSAWYIYTLIAALVLIALILVWLLYWRKRTEVLAEIYPLSAQELALRRLAELLESRRHESDVKGFFVELSDIVRWYVERLTGIRAPELTTEEFLNRIARPQQISQSGGSLKTLVPFLESADAVKFAKHVPTNDEMMLAFRRAEHFVQKS